jgi:hypothetical protein
MGGRKPENSATLGEICMTKMAWRSANFFDSKRNFLDSNALHFTSRALFLLIWSPVPQQV